MGNTLNSFDKPVYDDAYDLPSDLQDAVDFVMLFAFIRSGTAAARTALPSAKTPNGMLFTETDTGCVYLRRSGAWVLLSAPATRVYVEKVIAQNTVNGDAIVSWINSGSPIYDTASMFSTGQPTRITLPVAGWYEITYMVRTNGALPLTVTPRANGATLLPRGQSADIGASGAASTAGRTFRYQAAAGDYIELIVASTGAAAFLTTGACTIHAELIAG